MQKLFYIANIRMPTERAHGIQVMHMCSAFSRAGVDVTLLVPARKTIDADPFEYYGVERNFTIEKIPVPDIVSWGKAGFLIESALFALRAVRRVTAGASIYTREELPLLFVPARTRAYFEAHTVRKGLLFRGLIRQASGIIAISQGVADAVARFPFPKENICVAHDGYDEKQFAVLMTQKEARMRLGLPLHEKIALYIGGLEGWKGSDTLLTASKELLTQGIRVAIIGGSDAEVAVRQANYPDVIFLGRCPYRDIAINQRAGDVLVIPNSARERISREFTSPLKLFAYMASGVPIVASDLPSIREVLSEGDAFFFTPDDAHALAGAIRTALGSDGKTRATHAIEKARNYTWDKRAENILTFCRM